MAATATIPRYIDSQHHRKPLGIAHRPKHFLLHLPEYSKHFSLSFLPSHHSSSSSSFSSPPSPPPPPSTPSTSSDLWNPLGSGRFLSNDEHEKLRFLENFESFHELGSGYLRIHVMRAEEMDLAAELLAESFGQSMFLPTSYVSLLRFLVKQYLMEKRSLVPHTATLIGFFRRKESGKEEDAEEELAGTVEVCFNKRGANASPPTPTAPKDSPYICNMTVKDTVRRRGIGWHLLKASEELICQMSPSREVYLHCRMIDAAPFSMYMKAGYNVVKTDNILILLLLQRRKHLMRKMLPSFNSPSELDCLHSDDEVSL